MEYADGIRMLLGLPRSDKKTGQGTLTDALQKFHEAERQMLKGNGITTLVEELKTAHCGAGLKEADFEEDHAKQFLQERLDLLNKEFGTTGAQTGA